MFRSGSEGKIRTYLINADAVEGVLALAPNLFYGTTWGAHVLILRSSKDDTRRGKVLFVNGEKLFKPGRNQNSLEPAHTQQLLEAYQSFVDIDGLAYVASLDEIAGNNYDLTVSLYAAPINASDELTLADALSHVEAAYSRAAETGGALEAELAEWRLSGLGSAI